MLPVESHWSTSQWWNRTVLVMTSHDRRPTSQLVSQDGECNEWIMSSHGAVHGTQICLHSPVVRRTSNCATFTLFNFCWVFFRNFLPVIMVLCVSQTHLSFLCPGSGVIKWQTASGPSNDSVQICDISNKFTRLDEFESHGYFSQLKKIIF